MQPKTEAHVTRIILADDHELLRSGLRSLLRSLDDVEVIAEAGDGAQLITLTESLDPDIVLADLDMPRIDGLTAISHLKRTRPKVRCLVISMHEEVEMVRKAAAAGAVGYLMKHASAMELGMAIQSVRERGAYFSSAVTSMLLAPAEPGPADLLTERQLEVLKLMVQGLGAKEIAFELNLSSKTIDVHRARIMERLGIDDLPTLTRYAVRNGLIKV